MMLAISCEICLNVAQEKISNLVDIYVDDPHVMSMSFFDLELQ